MMIAVFHAPEQGVYRAQIYDTNEAWKPPSEGFIRTQDVEIRLLVKTGYSTIK